MRKITCDRCGTEIKEKDEHWVLEFKNNEDDPHFNYPIFTHDLCRTCLVPLRAQLQYVCE